MSAFASRLLCATFATVAMGAVLPGVVSNAYADAPPSLQPGLFGQQDPTYDGVYRQSLTLLALHASTTTIDPLAVQALRDQQCDDGSWTSYRTDVKRACGDTDSNATAMAVMALHAIGQTNPAKDGLKWLVQAQLAGGGWEYSPGWGADANSTGLVVQALIAMGVDPSTVTNNGSPLDFLTSLQLGCAAPSPERGSLDYQAQDPLAPNDYATAQAAQALVGTPLPVAPRAGTAELPEIDCTQQNSATSPGEAAVGYLGRRLETNDDSIPSAFGGGIDYGSTANSILALVAAGLGVDQVKAAIKTLESNVQSFAFDSDGDVLPAGASLLVLAEHAAGGDPSDVNGVDLPSKLSAAMTPAVDTDHNGGNHDGHQGGDNGQGGTTPGNGPNHESTGGGAANLPASGHTTAAATLANTGSSSTPGLLALMMVLAGLLLLRVAQPRKTKDLPPRAS